MEGVFEDIMSCTRKEKPMRNGDECKAVGEGVEVKSGGDVRAGAEQEVSAVKVDYHWDLFDSSSRIRSAGPWISRCLEACWHACWRCGRQIEI